jgi:hypothetical protein
MDNGAAVTGQKRVRGIEWVGATTLAHTCIITDTAGNEIFSKKCSVVHDGGGFTPVELDVNGLTAAMGSGYALVYLGNGNYQRMT